MQAEGHGHPRTASLCSLITHIYAPYIFIPEIIIHIFANVFTVHIIRKLSYLYYFQTKIETQAKIIERLRVSVCPSVTCVYTLQSSCNIVCVRVCLERGRSAVPAQQWRGNIRNQVRHLLNQILGMIFVSPDLIATCELFIHVHISVDMDASASTADLEPETTCCKSAEALVPLSEASAAYMPVTTVVAGERFLLHMIMYTDRKLLAIKLS